MAAVNEDYVPVKLGRSVPHFPVFTERAFPIGQERTRRFNKHISVKGGKLQRAENKG